MCQKETLLLLFFFFLEPHDLDAMLTKPYAFHFFKTRAGTLYFANSHEVVICFM